MFKINPYAAPPSSLVDKKKNALYIHDYCGDLMGLSAILFIVFGYIFETSLLFLVISTFTFPFRISIIVPFFITFYLIAPYILSEGKASVWIFAIFRIPKLVLLFTAIIQAFACYVGSLIEIDFLLLAEIAPLSEILHMSDETKMLLGISKLLLVLTVVNMLSGIVTNFILLTFPKRC